MHIQNIDPKINLIIKEVDQDLEKDLFKTLGKKNSSSIFEQLSVIKTPLSALEQIRGKISNFKSQVKSREWLKDELINKQIMNLVRLAVAISVIAAAVLGAFFLTNPIAIAAVVIVAFLIHTGLGMWVANDCGLKEGLSGAFIGMVAGPFLMLYQTISAFREKIGPEPLLSDVQRYKTELIGLEENLNQLKPDLEQAFRKLQETLEDTKQSWIEESKQIKKEMIEKSNADKDDLQQYLESIEKIAQENMKKIKKAEENIQEIEKMVTWLQNVLSHLSEK